MPFFQNPKMTCDWISMKDNNIPQYRSDRKGNPRCESCSIANLVNWRKSLIECQQLSQVIAVMLPQIEYCTPSMILSHFVMGKVERIWCQCALIHTSLVDLSSRGKTEVSMNDIAACQTVTDGEKKSLSKFIGKMNTKNGFNALFVSQSLQFH